MASKNKRRYERYDFFETGSPIIYSDFNSKICNYHHALMKNTGQHGIYFESDCPVTPGTVIDIKTEHFCSSSTCKVKWCKAKQSPDGKVNIYGIGLEC